MIKPAFQARLRLAALSGLLGIAVVAACAPGMARAEDDENSDSIWNLDRRIFRDVMRGIGLRDGSEPVIDYRERSPLVLPPSRELPPPEANAVRNPAWPVDPDATRRREAAAKKQTNPRGYDADYESRALLPSELNKPGSGSNKPGTAASVDAEGNAMSNAQLGYFGGLFSNGLNWDNNKNEVGTFTQEPPRTALTEPPAGYQTPSPAQPYGVTKRVQASKAANVMDIPAGGE
jgi:hypothetical protein